MTAMITNGFVTTVIVFSAPAAQLSAQTCPGAGRALRGSGSGRPLTLDASPSAGQISADGRPFVQQFSQTRAY